MPRLQFQLSLPGRSQLRFGRPYNRLLSDCCGKVEKVGYRVVNGDKALEMAR
jgi:hypothetical protein